MQNGHRARSRANSVIVVHLSVNRPQQLSLPVAVINFIDPLAINNCGWKWGLDFFFCFARMASRKRKWKLIMIDGREGDWELSEQAKVINMGFSFFHAFLMKQI